MRQGIGAVLAGLLAFGCTADVVLDPGSGFTIPNTTAGVVLPTISAAPDVLSAADPQLDGFDGWPLVFDATHHSVDGRTCTISIVRGDELVAELSAHASAGACAVVWDGLYEDGSRVPPGPAEVVATVSSADGEELARAATSIEVVRLGIGEIQLRATTGSRVPLLYRATDGVRRGFYELEADAPPFRMAPDVREEDGAVDLELADGQPRALPAPWEDLTSPPLDPRSADDVEHDTFNLPTAFVAGSELAVEATLSASVAGGDGGGAPTYNEVRVLPPEGTIFDGGDAFGHGEVLRALTSGSPVPNVGRYDLTLAWRFEARAPGGEWQPVPGEVVTTHRLYGLVDEPIFDFASVPHRAWVDVVDTVTGWVDGRTREADEVASEIIEGVYYDLGLSYDRERGASFYTDYGSGFTGAVFEASRFQDRADGTTINCSDAASIVSSYANMVGIDLRYHILTHRYLSGFDLNFIQAIGWMGFTETPFTSGRGAFRYHAVVGPPDGRFFDATLALDGDGIPTAPPHDLLLPQGLPEIDYKRALSSQWADIETSIDEKVRIR
jgi:hypothetical protein